MEDKEELAYKIGSIAATVLFVAATFITARGRHKYDLNVLSCVFFANTLTPHF